MRVQAIIDYVRERTGDADDATLLREINNTWLQLWHTLDAESALFEMEVSAGADRLITLPFYVFQLKGVKRHSSVPVTLYTPRPYYHYSASYQDNLEWRMLHKTPLMRSLGAACQLKLKAKRPNESAFTVTIKGPGNYGVTEWEDVTFGANDDVKTTQAVYADVSALSKSAFTITDVEVYDISNNLVAVLPADRTDVWCQVARVMDTKTQVQNTGVYYTILYKAHAPVLRFAGDVIPDDWGIVLQQAATAERFGTVKDKDDRVRGQAHEAKAGRFSYEVGRRANEGKDNLINLDPCPYYSDIRNV